MANALYDNGRNAFLTKLIDWVNDDIRALLVRTSGGGSGPYYTPDLAAHDFLNDIPSNSDCRPVAAVALSGKSASLNNGVADANDVTFPGVPAGDAISRVVLYLHTVDTREAAEHFWPWYSNEPRTIAVATASGSAEGWARMKSLPPVSPTTRG